MGDILIIEDEADLRETLQARLLSEGYSVRVAVDSEDGLFMILENKPNLVLLDMMTRSIHGTHFMQRLRHLPEGVNDSKVLVLTNMDNDIVREKVSTYGIEDYLIKSNTSLDELVSKIKMILSE